MNRELIIHVDSSEVSIALVEDKRLVELHEEKSQTGFSVGDIYLGKVKKIMPGLNAAFVNVGYEKDAFIHYLDLGMQFTSLHKYVGNLGAGKRSPKFENLKLDQPIGKSGKISNFIKTGEPILVQIAKEAISTKGPRLTSEISLAGRHVVLLPFSNKVSISQKIRANEEKKRLRKIVEQTLPRNYGVIVRTAATGQSDADIEQDILSLVKKWESVVAAMRTQQPPHLMLSEMSRTTSIVRDLLNGSFSAISIDDKPTYQEVKEYIKVIAPEKEKIVKLYKGKTPIFDNYDISKQIKSLFAQYVSLKRGAYLIIEHTEALHVIDVNSGNRAKVEDDQEKTAMEVNLMAAEEISRQLRLRDMGGIIVIDFIDMHKGENRQALHEKMQQLMSTDRAKHTVLPLSKFGLMQITRQRTRPETAPDVRETCPTCKGTGKIAPTVMLDRQIENQVAYFAADRGMKYMDIHVSPYVASFLTKGLISLRTRWAWKYRCKIKVTPDQSTGIIEARFLNRKGKEMK